MTQAYFQEFADIYKELLEWVSKRECEMIFKECGEKRIYPFSYVEFRTDDAL